VPKVKAPLLIQLAASDERINAMYAEYEAALTANNVPFEKHIYEGTQHGFQNNSTPRYHDSASRWRAERRCASR
jgi:carboxymethylenebutenolidase